LCFFSSKCGSSISGRFFIYRAQRFLLLNPSHHLGSSISTLLCLLFFPICWAIGGPGQFDSLMEWKAVRFISWT
jgi:hypothetical protein